MHALLSILVRVLQFVSQQMELCVFRAWLRLRTFYFEEETKMRKLTKTVSALLTIVMLMSVVLCAPFTVSAAETFTSGDYEYTVLYDDRAEITKYKGNETKVVIPSNTSGYSITCIGKFAFMGCKSLESVTIPESITRIDYGAFSNCTNLKSVSITNSENYIDIARFAFYECPSLKSVTLPQTACIYDWAFGYNYYEYSDKKSEDFTIYGYSDSNAETYTVNNGFKFISLGQATESGSRYIFKEGGDNYYCNLDEIYENSGLIAEFYSSDDYGNSDNLIGSCKISRYFNSDNSGWYYQGYCENINIADGCIRKFKDGNGKELCFIGSSSPGSSGWGIAGMNIILEVCPLTANVNVTLKLPEDIEYYEPIQDFDILTYYFYDKNPTSVINSYIYDGTPKIPKVEFFEKDGTACELEEGKDYTLTCTNNVNAGTATATIKGMGIYAGSTVIKNFTINKADQDLLANITTTNLKCGETAKIVAIGEGNITYCSSDESVAQVSSKGVVKAVGEGYTVITINAAGNNNYNSDTERIIVFVSGTVNTTEPTTKPDQIIGDVNGDGSITVLDATTLQKYISGLVSLSNEQLAFADTNGDGSVTVLDATAIQKYIAGLVTKLG